MGLNATALIGFALVLLAHAGYSAYEFSHYLKHLTITDANLPVDIIVETIVATVLFSFGIVLNAPQLQPVEFAKYAKILEKDGRSPFAFLENRLGYADLKKLRDVYADDKSQ
ncbi:magnesium transporter [Lipomyces japonicus]|uniref:magnesium transporter n=1 Tax=Lipomyces japonicus TaxID=56871 RepID=UPI0034CEDEC3